MPLSPPPNPFFLLSVSSFPQFSLVFAVSLVSPPLWYTIFLFPFSIPSCFNNFHVLYIAAAVGVPLVFPFQIFSHSTNQALTIITLSIGEGTRGFFYSYSEHRNFFCAGVLMISMVVTPLFFFTYFLGYSNHVQQTPLVSHLNHFSIYPLIFYLKGLKV